MLFQKIQDDLKTALKEKREFELGVLRMLASALKNREIEKRSSGQAPILTDDDVLGVLSREVKKRKEAAALYAKGGRSELEAKELREAEFIERYLPAQMDVQEIEDVVRRVINSGANDFASVMREAMKELRGRAEGKIVGDVVKKILSN